MKVVILAGGLGTRISEESHLRPKPMIEIGDRPILWHIMKHYAFFGYNDFIICTGYKGHFIKEYFANYYMHMSDVTYDFRDGNRMIVHQNVAEPWRVTIVDTGFNTQTGGRVKRIDKYVDNEPFMLTYGDGVGNIDLKLLLDCHRQSGKIATITAVQPGGRYGVLDFEDDMSTVAGFEEKAKEDGGWINAGFMVLEPEVFGYISGDDCSFESVAMKALVADEQLNAYRHTGFWQCMDTQRDKGRLEQLYASEHPPWKLWE